MGFHSEPEEHICSIQYVGSKSQVRQGWELNRK